jgi:uncharacterized protein
MPVETIALVIVAGFAAGILAALFGVGGGLLLVPFMVLVLDETQHVAEGTSLLVIVPTAAAGVLSHARNRFVSLRHTAYVAAGGLVGAFAGAEIALRTEGDSLTKVFALLVAAMGARTLYHGARAFREGRSRPPHGKDSAGF